MLDFVQLSEDSRGEAQTYLETVVTRLPERGVGSRLVVFLAAAAEAITRDGAGHRSGTYRLNPRTVVDGVSWLEDEVGGVDAKTSGSGPAREPRERGAEAWLLFGSVPVIRSIKVR